jgi:hypothetical protein
MAGHTEIEQLLQQTITTRVGNGNRSNKETPLTAHAN